MALSESDLAHIGHLSGTLTLVVVIHKTLNLNDLIHINLFLAHIKFN